MTNDQGRSIDLSAWLTAAALFWFEAWGLVGLVWIGVLPVMAFMHGTWPPSTWVDGSVLRLALLLAIVGASALVVWFSTGVDSRLRASALSVLGVAGLLATVAIALIGTEYVLPVAFWLVWPSLVLVIVWGQRAARIGTTSA